MVLAELLDEVVSVFQEVGALVGFGEVWDVCDGC